MGSRPVKHIPMPSRRSSNSRRQLSRRHTYKVSTATAVNGGATALSSISDKLEALKSLLPAQTADDINTDQLFEETAEYILMLRTQVSILQRMVDFYSSDQTEKNDCTVS